MKKYAKTLSAFEFFALFHNEAEACKFVESQIWGNKVDCVHCGSNRTAIRENRSGGHRCKDCRKEFTVKHGTIFENSRLCLRKWLYAIYLLQTSRKGVSSLQLSKEAGITQKTAWFVLHRLRECCDIGMISLAGIVEVDETFLGGKEANKHNNKKLKAGRGSVGKQAVMGIRERGGRVKAMTIQNADKATLQGNIAKHVKAGSIVYTDDHRGYTGLGGLFYKHHSVNHSAREYVNGMAHTNGIESVWAVLKRGYNGTYHNWSKRHCHRYVNEFTFRLNEGSVKIDTMDRIKSLVLGAKHKRLTYKELIA